MTLIYLKFDVIVLAKNNRLKGVGLSKPFQMKRTE